jgi:glycosyltransferase involved in cell wall biosynthesis
LEPRILKESATLARAGYRVEVLGWDRRRTYPAKETVDGVVFVRSRIPAPYGSKALALILPAFWIRAVAEALRTRPSVVHACDLDGYIPALVAGLLSGAKVVYDIFDIFAEKVTGLPPWLRKAINRLDRSLMPLADAVIVTDSTRRRLIEDVLLRRLEVVMNVPPQVPGVPFKSATGAMKVCFTGNLHEHRGLMFMAEALRGLEGVDAVFAGWATRKRDEEFLRSQSHIRYVGKLPYAESLALAARSDVSLAFYDPRLPINALASSNKVFEAMAVHRPVITNIETTMAPIVQAEDCGLLVRYGDTAALRAALVRLRDDRALRSRLGENGHAAFCREYNWEAMEARLLQLYRDIGVSAPPGRRSLTRSDGSSTATASM